MNVTRDRVNKFSSDEKSPSKPLENVKEKHCVTSKNALNCRLKKLFPSSDLRSILLECVDDLSQS